MVICTIHNRLKRSFLILKCAWGSGIDKRPYQHRHLRPLNVDVRVAASWLMVKPAAWKHPLIHRHFNYHSKIPFEGGIWKSEAAIHQMCAAEVYSFCRGREWWRTWVYFWAEWYTPEKWRLWARSVSVDLPVWKTIMILESHWRVLKHDILHPYNRRRMDLVVHCIIRELMPISVQKMYHLLSRNHRMYRASWRRHLKRQNLVTQCTPLM